MAGERRILLTGGGTTGHVVPNLAIYGELLRRDKSTRFLYVGSSGHESRHAPEAGIPFRAVASAPFASPRRPRRFLRMLVFQTLGFLQALWIIARFRPQVIVASGGYVSVPAVLAGALLRRPVCLHEQNVRPGLANRVCARFAAQVGVSFPETVASFPAGRAVLTGYPVRGHIGQGDASRARREFGIAEGTRVALICGGSLGARSINRATVAALRSLLSHEGIAIIHSTGLNQSREYDALSDTKDRLARIGLDSEIPGRYSCRSFIEGIEDAYALADLVVCRAGAGTVMELAAVGKANLLLPQTDTAGAHQLQNALALKEVGAADVIYEELGDDEGVAITRVPPESLARQITALLGDKERLEAMGERAKKIAFKDATAVNADLVLGLLDPKPRQQQIVEKDLCGFLRSDSGERRELLFRSNVLGGGLLADIPAGRGGKALIHRTRRSGVSEHRLAPLRGEVLLNGEKLRGSADLRHGDVVAVGGVPFVFETEEREIVRLRGQGSLGLKVVATAAGTLASRLVGFVREALTAAVLGLGNAADVLAIGLTVSNLLRGVFAEVAVDSAFLPTFIHLRQTGRSKAANRLFSSVLSLTVLLTAATSILAIATLPLWLPLLFGGLAERGLVGEAVALTRVMFPYLILVSVAAIFSAVLRAFNCFALPAASSILFSVGVLIGLAFYPMLGLPALAWGVLLGGLGQVLIQTPALFSKRLKTAGGLHFRARIDLHDPAVKKVGRITPNVVADVAALKLGGVVDKVLAVPFYGMVGSLYFALVLFRLPFGLVAQSINTVILKEVSEGQAMKDADWSRRLLSGGVQWSLFTLLPISVGMIVLAEPLVRLVFEWWRFGPEETLRVAGALRFYSVGLVAWGLTSLCGRFFSARLEQSRSTATSFAALGINIVLSVSFIRMGFGAEGLALATSLSFFACAGIRLRLLTRAYRDEGVELCVADLWREGSKIAAASAVAGVAMAVSFGAVAGFAGLPVFLSRLFVLAVPAAFGVFAFIATAFFFKSEPLEDLLLRLRRRRGVSEVPRAPAAVNPLCIGASALLRWVERHPRSLLDYNFARRVKTLLGSGSWQVRNQAVKLVGLLRIKTLRHDLCAKVVCREKASRWARLFGGDYREPGFVRRNAIASLRQISVCDSEVERALLEALGDRYYEVRSAAAGALKSFASQLTPASQEEAAERTRRLCADRNFEVARAATLALGELALDEGVLATLKRLHYHRNWRVREALIRTYGRLLKRGILKNDKQVLALLDDILITTEGFTPVFPLKETMQELQTSLLGGEEEQGGGAA